MDRFSIEAKPEGVNVVFQRDDLRITMLTPCLMRLEKGEFTDLPTQTVWNRDLGPVACRSEENGSLCTVRTEEAAFCVDIRQGKVNSVTLIDGTVVTDFHTGNLLGTARTLDRANGAVKLEPGILSRSGVSVMDDSRSLLLVEDGCIESRPACVDHYYFAYGHDYRRQLRDFFRLTGPVPLIPRYALGNWWSRYKAYSQEEYRSLMKQFIRRKLPITVATIDMDWHWTDVVERFGEKAKPGKPGCKEEIIFNTLLHGWTGYSWNTELFPDHKELLNWLHERNFHVTLNVHPSQGIRFFEDCYEAVCRKLGRDPEKQELIPFDITDRAFLEAYFEEIHRPMEEEGVDFWWLDWQQGTKTKVPGLDPLWALNHYHTLDRAGEEKRPLILSRYAGLGSHRYPLGFSGDTVVSWKSLDFQPYFTNTAANAGYTWWSHDIGGHMKGVQDDELYLRWLQYGVFSPINRLHSTCSDFMGKEPWKRSWAVEKIAEEFLRLRHRLIPYLYTANYQTHKEGTPISMPMYYRYDCEEAYQARNQYIFGGHLLVCPITRQADRRLNLGAAKVWLPEGRWTDIFNGRIYEGGKWVTMYRDMDSIPVLAAPGTIVPMYRSADSNDLSLEQPLEIQVWRGNGSYDLYEDDGESFGFARGQYAITSFNVKTCGDTLRFTIMPPAEDGGLLRETRRMYIRFRDIISGRVFVDGKERSCEDMCVCAEVFNTPVEVEIRDFRAAENEPKDEARINLLTRVQGGNDWKAACFGGKKKMPGYIQAALEELDALI